MPARKNWLARQLQLRAQEFAEHLGLNLEIDEHPQLKCPRYTLDLFTAHHARCKRRWCPFLRAKSRLVQTVEIRDIYVFLSGWKKALQVHGPKSP